MKTNAINSANVQRIAKAPAFTSASCVGRTLLKSKTASKLYHAFEPDNFTMPIWGLIVSLYGATLGLRYIQAYDKYDKKEILRRDSLSITSILFMAPILNRGFSKTLSKISGYALSHTEHVAKDSSMYKKAFQQIKNWCNPCNGISLTSNSKLTGKYSNIDGYKDGIVGFLNYIEKEGGNVKKFMTRNGKDLREKASAVMKLSSKDLKSASSAEVIEAFTQNKSSDEVKTIVEMFKKTDNRFVTNAKLMNNMFSFLTIFSLVPMFMVWIQNSNERMTKRAKAKDAEKLALQQKQKSTPPSPFTNFAGNKKA